ncbi:carboxymuconolactone decarboxylase family protein [Oceanobacillus salinisoli]|uniref:carboxymuconolactone decarboxylase family protein n=1 Tax=Oceanobacillus salinisoli TaxID=2678611 RepID=UPI0012E17CE3|nr:carboxymuconolactone decarboxylase family protein [Oceanobacillus salinisoli]
MDLKNKFLEIPDWFKELNEYHSQALDHLNKLKKEILSDGAISKKDKELILVGINAARRHEDSMLYHAKGAADSGATINELVEILTPCILSRGIPAWFEGVKAIQFFNEYKNETNKEMNGHTIDMDFQSVDEAIEYFKTEADGVKSEWIEVMEKEVSEVLLNYGNLRASILNDGKVPRKIKEFVLIGINIAERYEKGAELHISSARKLGATNEEIAEVAITSLLTAGIPAWFEGSMFLK